MFNDGLRILEHEVVKSVRIIFFPIRSGGLVV